MRKLQFKTGEYYHVYNRGVDGRNIFLDKKDYIRFIIGLREFNNENLGSLQAKKVLRASERLLEPSPPLVSIICYALLPNHYHFILKQEKELGTSKFMLKLGMGYANYFNFKNKRSGSLFQGTFKARHINKDSYLLRLSCYINGNPEIHKISKAEKWPWSSYLDYLNLRNGNLCCKEVILKDFLNILEYKNLTNLLIKDSKELKKFTLE